jgi:hypothetical protein
MVFVIVPAVRTVSVDNSPHADHLIDSTGYRYLSACTIRGSR